MGKDNDFFTVDEVRDDLLVDVPAADPEPEADTVVLVASNLSFFETAFTVEHDGDPLTFTRAGTEVPAGEADKIIENAATHGVVLTRKAN